MLDLSNIEEITRYIIVVRVNILVFKKRGVLE